MPFLRSPRPLARVPDQGDRPAGDDVHLPVPPSRAARQQAHGEAMKLDRDWPFILAIVIALASIILLLGGYQPTT